jgi:GNAT superfamily N-acetyltransferase
MIGAGLEVRPITENERLHVAVLVAREWGSTRIVSRGEVHDISRLPGFLCVAEEQLVGLATYEISRDHCQLLTIDAFEKKRGVGSRLLEAVIGRARAEGCRRLWLITTNDNLDAIRFYQRRGLRLIAVHPGAVEQARKLKPTIPQVGHYGITIRDELEFELDLGART